MHIVVLVKQVPETSAVRLDDTTGTMIREGVESIVNPLDLYAVEAALCLRDIACPEVRITALSMGPPKAEVALREVMSMGVDEAVLLTDRAFAGADTWSTSMVLAAAVRHVSPCDLILCGERATDGDTGQVGPGVAAFLDLPVVSYVTSMCLVHAGVCRAVRLVEGGRHHVEVDLPAVVTVVKEIGVPRLPTLQGKRRARGARVRHLSCADLELKADHVGLRGSPTRVERIFRPRVSRNGRIHLASTPAEMGPALDALMCLLSERNLPAPSPATSPKTGLPGLERRT